MRLELLRSRPGRTTKSLCQSSREGIGDVEVFGLKPPFHGGLEPSVGAGRAIPDRHSVIGTAFLAR